VYEGIALAYAEDDTAWSEDSENIFKYVDDGNRRVDVLGIGRDWKKETMF
jgi:hypothetical protein